MASYFTESLREHSQANSPDRHSSHGRIQKIVQSAYNKIRRNQKPVILPFLYDKKEYPNRICFNNFGYPLYSQKKFLANPLVRDFYDISTKTLFKAMTKGRGLALMYEEIIKPALDSNIFIGAISVLPVLATIKVARWVGTFGVMVSNLISRKLGQAVIVRVGGRFYRFLAPTSTLSRMGISRGKYLAIQAKRHIVRSAYLIAIYQPISVGFFYGTGYSESFLGAALSTERLLYNALFFGLYGPMLDSAFKVGSVFVRAIPGGSKGIETFMNQFVTLYYTSTIGKALWTATSHSLKVLSYAPIDMGYHTIKALYSERSLGSVPSLSDHWNNFANSFDANSAYIIVTRAWNKKAGMPYTPLPVSFPRTYTRANGAQPPKTGKRDSMDFDREPVRTGAGNATTSAIGDGAGVAGDGAGIVIDAGGP